MKIKKETYKEIKSVIKMKKDNYIYFKKTYNKMIKFIKKDRPYYENYKGERIYCEVRGCFKNSICKLRNEFLHFGIGLISYVCRKHKTSIGLVNY